MHIVMVAVKNKEANAMQEEEKKRFLAHSFRVNENCYILIYGWIPALVVQLQYQVKLYNQRGYVLELAFR